MLVSLKSRFYTTAALPLGAILLAATLSAGELKSITADQAQAENPAVNAFDSSSDTRWSANGRGRWIQCELSEPVRLSQIAIGFAHGERDYAFTIRTSADGKAWSNPSAFQSGGEPKTVPYQFEPVTARFVRISVHGSDANEWANIHTIAIPEVAPLKTPTPGTTQGERFVVSEWASDPAIANTVAISLDDRGRAYLTAARRRKQSSLDIRNHQDLVKKDLSLTTVEERRAWYRDYLTGKGWVPDRNEDGVRNWRDLTVQKDSLVQVTDTDGDGQGDAIRILDEYHSEVTGIAAGVLAVGSDVFVAAEPDFLRYVDQDGDGTPETRELVATGFQVHMGQGGHNLSGVALGPDGRVYWSLGDKGHYVETHEGKIYHMPNAGGIFRCELDGTRVERFSSGERNAQELAFDAHGNLFSMDNDGDYPGEMERALYITEGSEHGWRLNWQWLRKQDFIKISGIPAYNPWMDERLFLPDREDHAAYLTPTLGNFGPGPCGFTANPGTALSEALAHSFFMTNQQSQVRVFTFTPKGASFEFQEHAPIKGGVSNTGLAIGPDGALYSASYGPKRGAIFRFDVAEDQRHPLRSETQRILGLDSGKASVNQLTAWLDHPDQRVRMKGQFELVRRGLFNKLNEALMSEAKTPLGRLHALWGLGQIARRNPPMLTFVRMAWNHDDEPELIAQAAKVIGETPGSIGDLAGFRGKLIEGLAHESPRVRFFSAIALGNRGVPEAAGPLVELLETSGSTDPYLRHAAVMGLKGALSPSQLASLSTHRSRTVRLGAIVALRKLRAPEIRAFLEDDDELVLLEAARGIHDDQSIPEALPDLASLLDRPGLENEALMRRVINAAFRVGSYPALLRLEAYLKGGESSAKLRRTALASILWWSQPPVLDAVEGRYRAHAPRDAQPVNEAVARLLPVIMADGDLREVLLNGVAVREEARWLEGTEAHFATLPPPMQSKLLGALAKSKSPRLKVAVQDALASPDPGVRESAREYATAAGLPVVDLLLAILNDPKASGKGKAVKQLAELDDPRARKKLEELITAYHAGTTPPELKLELWRAARSQGIELPATPDRLAFGGDPDRGKELVRNHAAAQCLRCHMLGKDGSNLGPNLSRIGANRDRSQLVNSLLDPNRDIVEGYGTVLAKTKDGQEISGLLTKKEDDLWIIQLADNTKEIVNPKNLVSHSLSSAMPPMGTIMTPEEIRDVVSYLAGLK